MLPDDQAREEIKMWPENPSINESSAGGGV